jgi:hypothetical protein
MKTSSLEKFTSLTGLISVVLLVGGSLIFSVYDYLPSADKLSEIFNRDPFTVQISGYILTLSAFFMIWFVGGFYKVLRKQEGESPLFSHIAFASGVGSGIALLIGYSAIITVGARAAASGGISPGEAVTLYDFYSHIIGQMFPITFALFMGASAVVSLRSGLFPAWLGWVSLVIALGLVSPIGYMVIILALLWLLIISISIKLS